MYTPPNSITLDKVTQTQMRIGIQGYGGTGKTWSALTFPNPIVVNLDRGLGAHIGRSDVTELPFYSKDFCKQVTPKFNPVTELSDLLLHWLRTEGHKLEEDQTLIWDGGTGIQNAYHAWYKAHPIYSIKTGKEDDYAQWRLKVEFFGNLCEEFKKLKCHIIYICHEAERKEKDGTYSGKIRPLLTGQFQDQLLSHFTDWVRQHANDKPKDLDKVDSKILANWELTQEEYKSMCDTFPRNTLYYWQTESDNIFDGKVSSLIAFPRYIPANYKSFLKYSKQKVN